MCQENRLHEEMREYDGHEFSEKNSMLVTKNNKCYTNTNSLPRLLSRPSISSEEFTET